MTDELDNPGASSLENTQETIPNDDKTSICQDFMNRIQTLKTLPTTTKESKKQVWLEFISLWFEILQYPSFNVQSCYDECSQLIPLLYTSTNFYLLKREKDVARQSCLLCLSGLDQPHIKDYLSSTNDADELSKGKTYHYHIDFLLRIPSQSALYLSSPSVEDQKVLDKYTEVFILLIERIERCIPKYLETTATQNKYELGVLNQRALDLIWNLVDITAFVPTFLKCGLPMKVVGWLTQANKLTEKCRRPFLSIAHNISRHDDGADELNKYGAIDVIKQYQNTKLEGKDSRIVLIAMVLALLSTPEQLKSDTKDMNVVLNKLLQLVMNAAKGHLHRCNGFHVSEPLAVLVKMFVVEERTLDYILCHAETEPPTDMHSTIRLFISLFFEFSNALQGTDRLDQFTCIALLNILWSISFQPHYAQELIGKEKLIDTIQQFTEDNKEQEIVEQYKPRSMEGIKPAANGILHNLNKDKKDDTISNDQINFRDTPVSNSTKETSCKPMIMISYCHADNDFCSQLLHFLATRNDAFDVWIDQTHCQGAADLWELIADGIERSSTVVCLLSGQYFESKSCRQEFIYSVDSLKKKIIPVILENFEPKGWLGIRMTGLKYVRFRDSVRPDHNKMNEILNTILLSFSSSKPLVPKTDLFSYQHATPLPVILKTPELNTVLMQSKLAAPRPFNEWRSTGEDIHAWFAYNRLSEKLRDLFDFQTGEEMLRYAQLLIKDYDKQMNIYGKLFAQKYHGDEMPPHEFNRFALALEHLLEENRPLAPFNKQKPPEPIKSTACMIL
ncbi:unnamed protein product [Rotaria sp. Silwood2]|nr:unnamed protein product [Rotaria sp. Silwood2]CAF4478076.1 unnamed protein product [Rotaria sp. Silwood2]